MNTACCTLPLPPDMSQWMNTDCRVFRQTLHASDGKKGSPGVSSGMAGGLLHHGQRLGRQVERREPRVPQVAWGQGLLTGGGAGPRWQPLASTPNANISSATPVIAIAFAGVAPVPHAASRGGPRLQTPQTQTPRRISNPTKNKTGGYIWGGGAHALRNRNSPNPTFSEPRKNYEGFGTFRALFGGTVGH